MFAVLLLSITIAVVGQFLFKLGADKLQDASSIWDLAQNFWLISGFGAYFLSAIVYIYAIRTVPLVLAYPTLALGYVITPVLAIWILDERLVWMQWAGILLIAAGVSLMWKAA